MSVLVELGHGNLRVLLSAQNHDLLLTLGAFLESRQCQVSPAGNGTEAIHLLKQSGCPPFDIIITDIELPSAAAGWEVLRTARRLHPHTHIVVMTDASWTEAVVEALRLGAFDYLMKPIRLSDLERLVNRILDRLVLLEQSRNLAPRLLS